MCAAPLPFGTSIDFDCILLQHAVVSMGTWQAGVFRVKPTNADVAGWRY